MNSPWYETTHRWGQCNLTEIDGRDCDVGFWMDFWKKNDVQGIIVNAGGTVAYFPSKNPHQYRAKYLGERDLLGEIMTAARKAGIRVLARMDVNQIVKSLYDLKPEWAARKADGSPHMMKVRYITCVNSEYYETHIPGVMKEIYELYKPDGFVDNSWTGAGELLCYCENCKRLFKEYSGMDLPVKRDFDDKAYRLWLQWSILRRTRVWERYNEKMRGIGGEDCFWIGMIYPDFYPNRARLYDLAQISGPAHMVDHQRRDGVSGFDQNVVNGMTLHNLFGDDALIIQSMACYHFGGKYWMRRAANAPEETRSWMRAGIAGGISPSLHIIGTKQDDARMFDIPGPIYQWHKENEQYLYHRKLRANIGLAWSGPNRLYYGQDDIFNKCKAPFIGMVAAMKRRRMAFFPVNTAHIKRNIGEMDLLILPDLPVMTDEEMAAVKAHVEAGGSLLYTAASGMCDELGYEREKFLLDEMFGIERHSKKLLPVIMGERLTFGNLADYDLHNYIRVAEPRHEILAKPFEKTGIIELHGLYYEVSPRSPKLRAIAHIVEPFPVVPPEFAYIEDDKRVTGIPAILAGETGFGGRVVYIAADFERRFADIMFPDLGNLLANAIDWAVGGRHPFAVEGAGELDCKLYTQENRLVMHLLNHSGLNNFPRPVEEYFTAGPQEVSIPVSTAVKSVSLKVKGGEIPFNVKENTLFFTVDSIHDQELAVIELGANGGTR